RIACAATAMPNAPTIAIGYDEKISLCEAPHLGAADDMPKQSPAHHAQKGDTMRKSILFVAVVIITATAAVWSIATFARSKVAGPGEATETWGPVSPQEIRIKQGRTLPVEYWAHPFGGKAPGSPRPPILRWRKIFPLEPPRRLEPALVCAMIPM